VKSAPSERSGDAAAVVGHLQIRDNHAEVVEKMVRPERFELPTLWFVAKCSIQLSYGRDTVQPAEIRL
jgi:hypothetical protein